MEWWLGLSLALKIFYGISILSLLVVVVQMLLTLIGFDSDGLDFDIGDGIDSHSGIGIVSSQTLGAFFLGFGWMGVALLKGGFTLLISALLATLFGVVTMVAMFYLIRTLLKLQTRGNLDYNTVIGEKASVYVTLPGNSKDSGGQIQVTIQGRLTTASALKIDSGAAKPGEQVRIVDLQAPATFIVKSL